MKRIIVFIGLLIASVSSYAQEVEGALIKFESTEIDYGEMIKGSDGTRIFSFSNEGNEPLIINNVRSSCGCTIPEYSKKPIAPGEKSEIKVVYDTKRVGPFRKTITLFTNSIEQRMILTIKGKVINEDK